MSRPGVEASEVKGAEGLVKPVKLERLDSRPAKAPSRSLQLLESIAMQQYDVLCI